MAAKYFALLTNLGAAKLANAAALGTKLEITQMAVGDGGGTLPVPDPAITGLKGEKRRGAINLLTVDPINASEIIAEQVIPENEGGWWIREIGLFDKDGVLVAIANCPETYKPQLQEGSGRTQTIRMVLIVNSTDAITLKIDPSVVLSTRKYVDDKTIEVKSYADKLMQGAMAINKNGADIENVAFFLKNIGLSDAVHSNQLTGVIGSSRNAKMTVSDASSSAVFTADELIVQSSLGGLQYKLNSLSSTIDLRRSGAGGMDKGSTPVTGYIALYVIYNPKAQVSAILAVDATSVEVPEFYAGANMPTGFTASALVSIWRVDSSKFVVGYQFGRRIDVARDNMILSNSGNNSISPLLMSGFVPVNAKKVRGDLYLSSNKASDPLLFSIATSENRVGRYSYRGASSNFQSFYEVSIKTPQVIFYETSGVTGEGVMAISISGYEI